MLDRSLGVKTSFVRQVNDLFIKRSIPFASLDAVRILAEGLNTDFMIMPKSLICWKIWINSLSPCSDIAKRKLGRTPTER